MFVIPLLFVGAFALIAWGMLQRDGPASDAATEIARRRLASGELSLDEFERIVRRLGPRSRPPGTLANPILALGGALLLLLAVASMVTWAASATDWTWGWGHMGGMMGGGGSVQGTTQVTDAPEAEVLMRDSAYQPTTIEVRLGTRVTWTNNDSVPHSATDRDGRWDTGLFGKGASASQTFDKPGEFPYYCLVHPAMIGTVRVRS